jgi:hypothetical protein
MVACDSRSLGPKCHTEEAGTARQGTTSVLGMFDIPASVAPFFSLMVTQVIVRNARCVVGPCSLQQAPREWSGPAVWPEGGGGLWQPHRAHVGHHGGVPGAAGAVRVGREPVLGRQLHILAGARRGGQVSLASRHAHGPRGSLTGTGVVWGVLQLEGHHHPVHPLY